MYFQLWCGRICVRVFLPLLLLIVICLLYCELLCNGPKAQLRRQRHVRLFFVSYCYFFTVQNIYQIDQCSFYWLGSKSHGALIHWFNHITIILIIITTQLPTSFQQFLHSCLIVNSDQKLVLVRVVQQSKVVKRSQHHDAHWPRTSCVISSW